MAEKKVIELEIKTESVGSLKSELRKAQAEVAALSEKFGATSQEAINAAKRAAELKDAIGDAKSLTDAFNPDAKFNALSASIGGVLNGFQAFEGMVGLVGVESEALQETLLKVQSAMAVSQGIQGLMEARDNFKQLGAVASQALKGIRTGVAATGIGVLLVAVGTLVAYWDDIKELVSGVSEEQKKLNAQSQERLEFSKKQIENLALEENSLKLQGKSEKQILQYKIARYNAAINEAKVNLSGIEAEQKARQEAAQRNMEWAKLYIRFITEGIALSIRILAAPFDLMIMQANKVAEILGFQKVIAINFNEEISKVLDTVSTMGAKMIFDPEETKAEGQKTIEEAKKTLKQLESDRDGFLVQVRDIEKEDADKRKEARKDALEKQKEEWEKHKDEEILSLQTRNAQELEIVNKHEESKYGFLVYWGNATNEFIKQKSKERIEHDRQVRDFAIQSAQQTFDIISNLTELFGKKNEKSAKRAFEIQKAVSIAQATIDTYKSANAIFASAAANPATVLFPAQPFIAAGLAVAAGLVNVAKIASQKFEGGGSTASSGGGGTSGAGSMNGGTSAAITPNFNIVGNAQATNPLAGLGTQPIQAYVVSGEVTTAQSLDRNRINYATFG